MGTFLYSAMRNQVTHQIWHLLTSVNYPVKISDIAEWFCSCHHFCYFENDISSESIKLLDCNIQAREAYFWFRPEIKPIGLMYGILIKLKSTKKILLRRVSFWVSFPPKLGVIYLYGQKWSLKLKLKGPRPYL